MVGWATFDVDPCCHMIYTKGLAIGRRGCSGSGPRPGCLALKTRIHNVLRSISVACVAALLVSISLADAQTAGERIEGSVTAPSARRELAFPYQGLIGKVNVVEGEVIKAGQVLLVQDERIELKRLEGLTLEADRALVIAAKQAALENKAIELKRKTELFEGKALSESEFLSAQLEVVLAEAELNVSKHEEKSKIAEKQLQEVRVEYMTLKSPIDGIVEKIVQKEGEVADINKPSVIVVKNDPLYIEVKTLPVDLVQGLKKGQQLDVRYKGGEWMKAAISKIDPVADARSGTQGVRLEMANPENRSTGLEMEVKIPAASQTATR